MFFNATSSRIGKALRVFLSKKLQAEVPAPCQFPDFSPRWGQKAAGLLWAKSDRDRQQTTLCHFFRQTAQIKLYLMGC